MDISLLRIRTKDNQFHCIPFCIPDGVFTAKSCQSGQKVNVWPKPATPMRAARLVLPTAPPKAQYQGGFFPVRP